MGETSPPAHTAQEVGEEFVQEYYALLQHRSNRAHELHRELSGLEMAKTSPARTAQEFGNEFVQKYYHVLLHQPDLAHKFYRELSILSRSSSNELMLNVTTLQGIKKMISQYNYSACMMKKKTVDAQDCYMGGVIVVVTGSFQEAPKVATTFLQIFLLAPEAKDFYILNDLFRLVDEVKASTPLKVSDANENVENTPSTPKQGRFMPSVHQPDTAHEFYRELSILGRPSSYEIMLNVTSLHAIKQMISPYNYSACKIKINTINSQDSYMGGVLVVVTGFFQEAPNVSTSNVARRFWQTFFLAPEGKDYYISNDVFRFVGEVKESTPSKVSGANEKVESTPSTPKQGCHSHTHVQEKQQASTTHFGLSEWYFGTGPNSVSELELYIDAAFCSSSEDKAYLLMQDEYVVLGYASSMRDAKLLKGPLRICEGFPFLEDSCFSDYGISAAFRSGENEAIIFAGNLCAKINFEVDGKYIQGLMTITDMFPFLEQTLFDDGIDAALESSVSNEVYLFQDDQCACIKYNSDSWDLVGAICPISEAFPILKDTIFSSGIEAACASRTIDCYEVYIFKGAHYACMSFGPTSNPNSKRCSMPSFDMGEVLPCLRSILPCKNYCSTIPRKNYGN